MVYIYVYIDIYDAPIISKLQAQSAEVGCQEQQGRLRCGVV